MVLTKEQMCPHCGQDMDEIYECEFCKKEHEYIENAEQCEKDHKENKDANYSKEMLRRASEHPEQTILR